MDVLMYANMYTSRIELLLMFAHGLCTVYAGVISQDGKGCDVFHL